MEMYLLHHDEYEHFYNCSAKTTEEWSQIGVQNLGVGIFSIVVGVITLPIYIPCMKTMLEPELWRYSCYKLMFFNGVIDIIGTVKSCFYTSYLAIQGTVFCHNPNFNYIYGCIIMGLWATQCMMAVLLAFNRCADFWQNKYISSLFQSWKTYACYLLPIAYFLYFFIFVPPCLYSSFVNMWILDPFLGTDINVDAVLYKRAWALNVNNTLLVAILSILYIVLILSIWWKSRLCQGQLMNKVQRQVTLQAFLICLIIDANGIIYVLFEFVTLPGIFMTFVFFMWQWSCVGGAFIYLILNKTLRNGVYRFYFGRRAEVTSTNGLVNLQSGQRSTSNASRKTDH